MKSEVVQKPSAEFAVNIQLTENEARAWDAIVGYGWNAFIEVFEAKLGKHYIAPYRADAKRMFEHTRSTIGMQLHGIVAAKKAIGELNLTGANEVIIK